MTLPFKRIVGGVVVTAASLLVTGVSLAQGENIMHGGLWGAGGMVGYGGIWMPGLLVIAVVGLVVRLVRQKRKQTAGPGESAPLRI